MEIDSKFYVLLDKTLEKMAKQDEIILNRSATDRKLQSVAVQTFLSRSQRFESLSKGFLQSTVFSSEITDKQLAGEKNLARLRLFGKFWKENGRKVETLDSSSLKELQEEKKRTEDAVLRLKSFKQELGGSKLSVESLNNNISDKDEKAFQRLVEAIEKLQAKSKAIDKKLLESEKG